jgi:hypothetical protein
MKLRVPFLTALAISLFFWNISARAAEKHVALHTALKHLQEAKPHLSKEKKHEFVERAHKSVKEAIRYVKESKHEFNGHRKVLIEHLEHVDKSFHENHTKSGKHVDTVIETIHKALK